MKRKCEHVWVDATNQVVSGTKLCLKCLYASPMSDVERNEINANFVMPQLNKIHPDIRDRIVMQDKNTK